ncbi:hypothetical protein [Actinomadura opuntiae]|uniref:hypothetical protein n=1 Tax=Actinomadura sp. OS1-43 TaxID=604315 RepID=UPI00255AF0D7|nr:hypothetical protein [Actinomadura sp. OS1-43]MDL4814852.1 hypothetical protein [Actinomadura sp. OS1-43]
MPSRGWLSRIDEALGWLLYRLAFIVVVVLALGLLASVAIIAAGLLRVAPAYTLGAAVLLVLLYGLARRSGGRNNIPPEWYSSKCGACTHSRAEHWAGQGHCTMEVAPFYTETISMFEYEEIKVRRGRPCGCDTYRPA